MCETVFWIVFQVNNASTYALWASVGKGVQKCCFPHKIIFSRTLWVRSKGNWTPTDTVSLLFGPQHICEVGLRNPPFFSCICFSPSEATSRACTFLDSFIWVRFEWRTSSELGRNRTYSRLFGCCLSGLIPFGHSWSRFGMSRYFNNGRFF